jgi:predicted ATPase
MISSFHIGNFKSYRDARLPLAPLTLLIGANASGKSNAIEAIRLLSMLADGRRIDDVLSEIQSSDDVIRGTSMDLPRQPGEPIMLGCELEKMEWNQLEIALTVEVGGAGGAIGDEVISNQQGDTLYKLQRPPRPSESERFLWYNNFGSRSGNQAIIPMSSQQAFFTQLQSPAAFDRLSSAAVLIPQTVAAFRSRLSSIRFFDPQPRRMRGYSFSGERVLKEDGSNVSAVLLDLSRLIRDPRAVLDFVADLPEQPFVNMGFIKTERGDVMVRLMESYGDREEVRDAPVLSDGTLRVLGIAAAIFSAEPGSTIVIEEIDNGVHPSRAETLLRNIEHVAKERDLRVLLTTHNPALLDRLPTEAIPHVVCAYRDPDEGDSRLVRLEDLPSYPELIARGPLGQLMTRGVLDYFLKHQRSAEEKEEQTQRWLDALKAQVGDA